MDDIAKISFVEGTELPDFRALATDSAIGGSARDLLDALAAVDGDRIEALLLRDPGLSRFSVDDRTLAELAVATGDASVVQRLLAHEALPDANGDGAPLVLALHARHPDLAHALLAAGADPTPKAALLEPFRAAIALGSVGGVRMLLDHGADPNVSGPLARRPLHIALDMEKFAIAERLIEAGADPWAIDSSGANLGTAVTTPMLTDSPGDHAAQRRLATKAQGLGWPDPVPSPQKVRALADEGRWPPIRLLH